MKKASKPATYDKHATIFDLIPYDDTNTNILCFMPLHINGKEIRRIVSAGETHLLYDVMSRNTGIREGVPQAGLPTTLVQDNRSNGYGPSFLAYGILVPQHGDENWTEDTVRGILDRFKGEPLQSVQREGDQSVLDAFWYRDYTFDYTLLSKRGHIPCAFLMRASFDYPAFMKATRDDEDYLGTVISPALPGLSVADNILNRDFAIIIRDIEPDFSGHRLFWKRAINKDGLKQAAANLA